MRVAIVSDQAFAAVLARLREILGVERDLLLTGRAKEAVSLIEEKSDVLRQVETALEAQDPNSIPSAQRREIEAVFQLAEENAMHFEAVRNGLRNAIGRIEAMHANAYVGSYGKDGGKVPFSEATGQYRTKA